MRRVSQPLPPPPETSWKKLWSTRLFWTICEPSPPNMTMLPTTLRGPKSLWSMRVWWVVPFMTIQSLAPAGRG